MLRVYLSRTHVLGRACDAVRHTMGTQAPFVLTKKVESGCAACVRGNQGRAHTFELVDLAVYLELVLFGIPALRASNFEVLQNLPVASHDRQDMMMMMMMMG
jgi:hypothetical protein